IVTVRTPERRKLITGSTRCTLAPSVRAVTCGANPGIDARAAAEIGRTSGLLDPQRAGSDQPCAVGHPSREPADVGGKGFHLAALEREDAAIHAPLHAAVDAFFERDDRAFASTVSGELPPNAGHRHGIGLGTGLQVTILASQVVTGETLGCLRHRW